MPTKVLKFKTFVVFLYNKNNYLCKNILKSRKMATIGKKLLKFRKENKLSQSQIAEKLAVSQTAYGKWEADEHKPNLDNLQKIAMFYNIDISDLLDENEKIVISNNEIGDNNIFGNSVPTINIQTSKELIEKVLQISNNFTQILEMQAKILEKISK
jgi:transcriptional regulator with XRE-family HTH domain